MTNQHAPTTRQQAPTTHRFVPVTEASRILGLSATTIRRKIDAGELEAERVTRPQGTAFLVKVPGDEPPRTDQALQMPQDESGSPRDAPADAVSLAAIVVPLVAQFDALRQTVERQSAQLISQAETIGRVTAERDAARAELDALRAQNATLTASTATQNQEPTTGPATIWQRLWRVVAAAY